MNGRVLEDWSPLVDVNTGRVFSYTGRRLTADDMAKWDHKPISEWGMGFGLDVTHYEIDGDGFVSAKDTPEIEAAWDAHLGQLGRRRKAIFDELGKWPA